LAAISQPKPVPHTGVRRWSGDPVFLVQSLIVRDFKIRYRNMSLGVFWSVLNPLVMMGVLWFIFTKIFPNNNTPNFTVFVLCGLVPFTVFSTSWISGTVSVVANAGLVKRGSAPRELIPISVVLSNCVYMSTQVLLLLVFVLAHGLGVNRYWAWLLLIWPLEIMFAIGLSLAFSALNVYVRDTQYVVESANLVLFWLVPIFYDFSQIPQRFKNLYEYNPVAALVLASRLILMHHTAPGAALVLKLAASSTLVLLVGLYIFRRLQSGFYNYL
jgi:lipopolysaccharide transport system permease protein